MPLYNETLSEFHYLTNLLVKLPNHALQKRYKLKRTALNRSFPITACFFLVFYEFLNCSIAQVSSAQLYCVIYSP